ncbi:uncharacterized protein C2orf73 homolog isoform X1 [Rhineura floridana]|uniref:uncharacterized protein C2orf73 homolog isoform X1 n=1 Tax=Rhineura floridana TaxID=261503 RepID=UPI002AC83703|nr:uncharacterized protein C2orf73 homolog isoform X1 [Rhineura floridana]
MSPTQKEVPLNPTRLTPSPNTYRVFNLEFPERNNILAKIQEEYTPKEQQHRYILECRNNPQPIHAKCIKFNTKFLNEPILYMDTEDTKTKQDHWWPSSEPFVPCPKPPYDKQSTQRNDFQKPSCRLCRPIKHSSKLQPSRGIVPLASPRPPASLPRIFQEQLSFKHDYNARATPCIPYQGKKRGTFVWTEINPTKGTAVPEGTEAIPCVRGSGSLEQPKTEKGNSAESSMTSACLCLSDSPETPPDSSVHLSKTDSSAGAKADPGAPGKGHGESSEISQSKEVTVSHPAGERPSSPPKKGSPDKPQEDCLPPVHRHAISGRTSDGLRRTAQVRGSCPGVISGTPNTN